MYFKSLEMFGFKSFADKTKINFEKGITAIVGPNGCGKSNIADAVRWVLGEQSAKSLRGAQMEDVVFNGTDLREPLGYAEVSLTLSNESKFLPIEYDEVTITRRLYRSGESEYLINKNLVRLKDINEMLMGSGMGINAYSMIEQGKIGQILSTNPDDRRAVFEEASGITRYKSKKREAMRKLEHTEQNLSRVNDIAKEVERQVNSIERQARKARRYQELFDRLKDLDTRLAGYKYSGMSTKKNALETEKAGIKDRESEYTNCINEIDRELTELKEKDNKLKSKISQYRSDSSEADISLRKNHDKINLDKERLQELQRFEIDLKNEIDSSSSRIDDMAKMIDDVTNKLTLMLKESREKESMLVAKEAELASLKEEITRNGDSIRSNKLSVVDVLSVQSRARNEIAKITSDMQNVQARLRRLNMEKENVIKEITALDSNLSQARQAVNEIITKVESLEQERIALQNSLKKEKDTFVILEKNINDSKNSILSLHSKLNFLKDLVKRNEGFTGGTQSLLKGLSERKLSIEGICKPLAELLEPKRGYEAACEAALLENLQTLIVDDWKASFTAIEYLKRNNLGKASFIKQNGYTDTGDSMPENRLILGKMINFIKFDPQYTSLFKELLRDTYLVSSVQDADSLMEALDVENKKRMKFVTAKGDIITKDKITGGSHSEDFTSSVIGRQRRIRETEEHIEQSEKEVLSLKQELHVKKELMEDYQAKIKRVEGLLRTEEIELAQRKSAEMNLEKEHKKVKEEVDLVELEMEESLLRKDELINNENELKAKVEEAAKAEAELQRLITDSQNFVETGANKREDLVVSITQIQTELTSIKGQEDEFIKRAQNQKEYYEEQVKILDNKKDSREESSRKQAELRDEVKALETDSEHLKERVVIVEKELNILEEEELQLRKIVQEKEEKVNKEKEGLGGIKDKTHSIEMEQTQISFQMESIRNKIGQVYKMDLEEILPTLGGIDNPDAVEEEVDQLSQTVEKVGPVNLVAIDEHKELQERYAFLKHQQEDLASAKEQLLKAIRKINQTTRSLFIETFESIQVEFKNYFRFLFGGGKAEIVLLDDKDVLESGIEIIVRPPGKKLQTISLLSGGEKALTATALLFAMFKIKPSPFCFLDEIDAPLDESNIGRFSKALEEFAKQSQFIIITHNKKTISIADIMYGITMQQSGVSKIISVKLSKKNEKKEAVLA
ncbi:MAG: chromosome segregation protein SMC [Candidatus Omnitrophica bacterium]|nr:chromosome segregation protein SMC [Candidatus Omnitrophota bacterium]